VFWHLQAGKGACRKQNTPKTSAPNHHSTQTDAAEQQHKQCASTAALAAPRKQSTTVKATGRVVETLKRQHMKMSGF
jgi:hypothetical protein